MPPIQPLKSTQPKFATPTILFSSESDKRVERLAINVVDLQRLPQEYVRKALQGKVDSSPIHIDKNREDEIGVIFSCPLVVAGSICDIIIGVDIEAGRVPTRIYLKRRSAWQRLASDVVLTVAELVNGKTVIKLNPLLFVEELELLPIEPPKTEIVEL